MSPKTEAQSGIATIKTHYAGTLTEKKKIHDICLQHFLYEMFLRLLRM